MVAELIGAKPGRPDDKNDSKLAVSLGHPIWNGPSLHNFSFLKDSTFPSFDFYIKIIHFFSIVHFPVYARNKDDIYVILIFGKI